MTQFLLIAKLREAKLILTGSIVVFINLAYFVGIGINCYVLCKSKEFMNTETRKCL